METVEPHVLVLGAGINGAAVARELALNGVSVTVVDAGDIACGATAYSSRLIHGGLRYLEYGEFGLVRESLTERTRLLNLAPHFVRPLKLFVPVGARWSGMTGAAGRFFGWRSKQKAPQPRGLWLVNAGLRFYDQLARGSPLPRRGVHRVGEADAPPVDPSKFRWLCSYWDAQIVYPERFTLALLEDARRAAQFAGASFQVFTYHEAELQGRAVAVRPRSGSDGPVEPAAAVAEFQPSAVINATGAWVDATLRRLQVPSPRLMGGTKGSHILTHHPALRAALDGNGVYAEAEDGRPVFLLPFGDATLIGTTDLPYPAPPETAIASEGEIAYLLDAANAVFPQAGLARDDVTMHYSSVRPLPYADAATPAAITRRHFLKEHDGTGLPLFSIIGGKLTTCRSLAEETATVVLDRLGQPPLTTSCERPIPGGEHYPAAAELEAEQMRLAGQLGFSREQVRSVWRLCGGMTEMALRQGDAASSATDDHANLPGTSIPLAFVRYSLRQEWPRQLTDLVERRLLLHFDPALTNAALEKLGELMIEAGALPAHRLNEEFKACRQRLAQHYGRAVD